MSIITDALNRLQAERARRPRQPRTSATPDNAEAADFRDPVFSPPPHPARALRTHLSLVVLGSIGIAAYLWGLPLIAVPDKVSPAQETVKELNPVPHVPSQIVEAIPERREEPFTATAAKASEDSQPAEAASAMVTDPPAKTTVAKDTPARSTRSSPGVRSTAKPPPVHNVDSASSNQSKNRIASFLRHATPRQVKLARAHYFIKKRRYARAVTVLQPLFVQPPEHWEPWFWLGTAQLGLGQWEKARASLVEGLARDATVPQLWVQRALVSQQQGRFGEALDALRQAELLAPELPDVQLNLAYALDAEGNRLVAIKHYRTFLSLTEGKNPYHATRKKVLERISRLIKT